MKKRPTMRVVRQRVVFCTLVFCAALVAYITLHGSQAIIDSTIITCAFTLSGTVIGCYLFGETWNEISTTKVNAEQAIQVAQQEVEHVIVPLPPSGPKAQ